MSAVFTYRLKFTFGITVTLSKPVNCFARAVCEQSGVPFDFVKSPTYVPPKYSWAGPFPYPCLARHFSSPASATAAETTHLFTSAQHPSAMGYGGVKPKDLPPAEALCSLLASIRLLSRSPPPAVQPYQPVRIALAKVAHSGARIRGASGDQSHKLVVPQPIKQAMDIVQDEERSGKQLSAEDIKASYGESLVRELEQLGSKWPTYGLWRIGSTVNPSSVVALAVAVWKVGKSRYLTAKLRATRESVPTAANPHSSLINLSATSDGRIAAVNGLVGAAYAGDAVRQKLLAPLSPSVNVNSTLGWLAATSDGRIAAVDGNIGTGLSGHRGRLGFRDPVPPAVNVNSTLTRLTAASNGRIAAVNSQTGSTLARIDAMTKERMPVPPSINRNSSLRINPESCLLHLTGTSDGRIATQDVDEGAAQRCLDKKAGLRVLMLGGASLDSSLAHVAGTSDGRIGTVAVTGGTMTLLNKAARRREKAEPSEKKKR
ncbi:hypothetical protein JCM10213_004953 [Rhodosporidiobolus nylandii]